MARQFYQVTVSAAGRTYVTTDMADSREKNPAANAQRKAMQAIVEKFPELDGLCLKVEDVAQVDHPQALRRIPTAEEKAEFNRRSMLWRLGEKAKADPMAALLAHIERFAGQGRYANVAEALAWRAEDTMKIDLERAWARTILDGLHDDGATYLDDAPEFEMSGGYRIDDAVKFDELIRSFARQTLKKGLHVQSTSSSELHNVKERLERDVAASLYEFLTEGELF